MEAETNRLVIMATEDETLVVNKYHSRTLFDYVDEYCFDEWACRGHCINVEDFTGALDFDELQRTATYDTDALLTLVELIYNFWILSHKKFSDNEKGHTLNWCGNYYHLKNVMDDVLGQYNHTAFVDEDKDCVLVVEDKAEITAVAEIMPTYELAFDVIKYNHRSLKGQIELKKKILLALGAELEPKRKQLRSLNSKLEDDIFYMLNNLNIRHNNRSKTDKNYKEYVAKMRKDRLEKWYDELYQMSLLAFLLLDNSKRAEDIKELRTKINGGQTNG